MDLKYAAVFLTLFATVGLAYSFSVTPNNVTAASGDNETLLLQFNLTFAGFTNSTEPVFVTITPRSSFFDIQLAPTMMTILNDSNRTLVAQISVPPHYLAQNYSSELVIERKNSSSTLVDIVPIANQVIPSFNISIAGPALVNASTEEKGNLEYTITTSGNRDEVMTIEVTSNVTNQSVLLPFQDTIPLYRKTVLNIPFFFTIPRILKGEHKEKILFTIGNTTIERNITFNVTDTEAPVINRVAVDGALKIYKPFTLKVNVTDNIDIDSVFLTSECLPTNSTRLKKGLPPFWETDLVITRVGLCPMIVSINDTSGNSDVGFANVTLEKLGGIELRTEVANPKIRFDRPFTALLMSVSQPMNVTVRLNQMVWQQYIFNPETNSTELTRSNQSVPTIAVNYDGINVLLPENETKNVTLLTDLFVTVTGGQKGFYKAFLTVQMPDGVLEQSVYEVVVEGEIADYSVTPAFDGMLLDRPARCDANDVGIYENSSYKCTLDYPVDTPFDAISFPYPKTYLDGKLAEKDQKITFWQGIAEDRGLYLLIVGIILVLSPVGYFVYKRWSEGMSV